MKRALANLALEVVLRCLAIVWMIGIASATEQAKRERKCHGI